MSYVVDTLWYMRCPVPTPTAIAAQLGWFEEEFRADGFKVRPLRESILPEAPSSHFEHNLAHALRQGGSAPAIWARSRGQDTRVVALTWTDEYQAIIALPSSGVRSVKDLNGRRLGLPKRAVAIDHARGSALRGFEVALATEGLTITDVELVDLSGDGRPRSPLADLDRHAYASEAYALARGDADAVSSRAWPAPSSPNSWAPWWWPTWASTPIPSCASAAARRGR